MSIERNNKLVNGSGLSRALELLKSRMDSEADAITTSLDYYVKKDSVISTGPADGTPIANIAGVTIYAPISQEGIAVETDPDFHASPAANITESDITKWNSAIDVSALTPYVEKSSIVSSGPTTGTEIANIAGVTIYAPVAEGGIAIETDPVFSSSAAYGITATDIIKWNSAIDSSALTPYAPIEYVDDAINSITTNYVPVSVTIEGDGNNPSRTTSINNTGNEISLNADEGQGQNSSYINLATNGLDLENDVLITLGGFASPTIYIGSTTTKTIINGVTTPASNLMAANKKYVDDEISASIDHLDDNLQQWVDDNYIRNKIENSSGITSTVSHNLGTTGSTPQFVVDIKGTDSAYSILSVKKNEILLDSPSMEIGHNGETVYISPSVLTQISAPTIIIGASSGSKVIIDGVTTPTTNFMVANKKYVDDAITTVAPATITVTQETPVISGTTVPLAEINGTTIYVSRIALTSDFDDLVNLTDCVTVSDVVPERFITGTAIATIAGVTIYAPESGSSAVVSVTPTLRSGMTIGTVNGTALYAPTITTSMTTGVEIAKVEWSEGNLRDPVAHTTTLYAPSVPVQNYVFEITTSASIGTHTYDCISGNYSDAADLIDTLNSSNVNVFTKISVISSEVGNQGVKRVVYYPLVMWDQENNKLLFATPNSSITSASENYNLDDIIAINSSNAVAADTHYNNSSNNNGNETI